MKHFIFAVILMVATLELRAQTGLSSLLVTNINALDFKVNISPTNSVTNIVKMNLSRSQFQAPVVPGDVWTLTNISGVYGGSTNITTNSIWGIDGSGHITPIVTNNAVIATNIVRAGHGVNTGSETWQTKSIVLTNGVNYLPVADYSQLQLISPSSDPSLVQIVLSNGWSTVQHLEIFNLTNAVPSQGAFTLINLTPIPDSLGGGVVKLINGEDWVSTNGCGIELRFISPDWVEQFRSDVSGNPTFISNTFNNITVISNTTLRGRFTINNISVTTNTLWTTNVVLGTTNLQPVDVTLQPHTEKGWTIGTHATNWHSGALTNGESLISSRSVPDGDVNNNEIQIETKNSTMAADVDIWTRTNSANLSRFSSINSINYEIVDNVVDGDLLSQWIWGTYPLAVIHPSATNGASPYSLGTSISHTSGNLLQVSNGPGASNTNMATVDWFGSVRASQGTEAHPSFSFLSDTATGFWNPSANNLGIMGGGTAVGVFGPTGLRLGSGSILGWTSGDPSLTSQVVEIQHGTGDPEGVLNGNVGDLYLRYGGTAGLGTTLYTKYANSGGNTGWTNAIGSGGGTTINPHDKFIPLRTNSTTFVDSPIVYPSNSGGHYIGFTNFSGGYFLEMDLTGGFGYFSDTAGNVTVGHGNVIVNPTSVTNGNPLLMTYPGVDLLSNNGATPGASENSPGLRWIGNGYATNSTLSLPVRFGAWVQATNGANQPSGQWLLQSAISNTVYSTAMAVNANSGYDGTGNLVLTSDGTYKSLSGLGGGGNMTNSGAAVVGMVPVATSTSGGSWTPTNAVTMLGYNVATLTPVDAGVLLDLGAASFASIALTGKVTFTAANLVAGRKYRLHISNAQATNCAYVWPWPSTNWLGAASPGSIAAGKQAEMEVTSWGTTTNAVLATYAEQP